MSITANMIANEKRFEGNVPYMYLDTGGNVTVGVGKLLRNAAAAQTLPFVTKAAGADAAAAAIAAEWQTVHGLEAGHAAAYYDPLTTLRLNQPDIDSRLTADLTAVEQQLQAQFALYGSFPASAQEGLMDMGFNLGVAKLISGFPTFIAAVRANPPQWTTAAAECHREGISDDRNDFVEALFNSAANG